MAHANDCCSVPVAVRLPLKKRIRSALLAVLTVLLLATVLTPIFQRIIPTDSVSATAAIGTIFVLGLIASVSTCLASTGGFLLAYTANASSTKRTLEVHIGRLSAFAAGGALLGALGGALPAWSPAWYGALAVLLGLGFLGVALHLFDLMPSLSSIGIALPSSLFTVGDRIRGSKRPFTPFLVGAVTFILPCGFTQTAQALALASGSPARGAFIMTAFAFGTLPVLAGMTLFATKAAASHSFMRTTAGAVIFLFAFGQLQAGASVLGIALPSFDDGAPGIATVQAKEQVVSMEVNSYGYWPANFIIKKGVPVRWDVFANDIGGCTDTLVSRDLNISKTLVKGMNELSFIPERTGKIAFSCGMGMVRGSFTVIN